MSIINDQLTFIVRYINKSGCTAERFSKFLPLLNHSDESFQQDVLKTLNEITFSLDDYRGQSYDNAANMSGKYAGLQAKIKEINPLADYILCAAHSLNLVGIASVKCCLDSCNFLGLVQELYAYSVGSTKRWNLLTNGLSSNENGRILTLKSLSSTRWHFHSELVKALQINYSNIYAMLNEIVNNEQVKGDARLAASIFVEKMCRLENAYMCVLWNKILQLFQIAGTLLQNANIDIYMTVLLFLSLESFVAELRDQFDVVENEAKNLTKSVQQVYAKGAKQQTTA